MVGDLRRSQGRQPRRRAVRARRRVRGRHGRHVRGARDGVRARRARRSASVPGQPVGGRADGAVLRGDGRVDVRRLRAQRCRAGCSSACRGWAARASAARSPWAWSAASSPRRARGRCSPACWPTSTTHARRRLGASHAVHLRARHGRAVLAARGVLGVAAASRPLDGVGQELLRHPAPAGGACTTCDNVVPALRAVQVAEPAVRDRDGGDDRRRASCWARSTPASTAAWLERLRKGLGVGADGGGAARPQQLPADAQGRDPAAWLHRRDHRAGAGARRRAPGAGRFRAPTGASRARNWTSRSSPAARSPS